MDVHVDLIGDGGYTWFGGGIKTVTGPEGTVTVPIEVGEDKGKGVGGDGDGVESTIIYSPPTDGRAPFAFGVGRRVEWNGIDQPPIHPPTHPPN